MENKELEQSLSRDFVAKNIEDHDSTLKNDFPRKFVGIEDVVRDLEQQDQLEKPPKWFGDFAKQAMDLWFDPKSFESEELYERLGVKTFKKYAPTGEVAAKLIWKSSKENLFIKGSSELDLRKYEKFTRFYETLHTTAVPIMAAIIGINLARGNIESAAFITALNTLVNVYPILMQRYNRLRLYKAISRAEEREKRRSTNDSQNDLNRVSQ